MSVVVKDALVVSGILLLLAVLLMALYRPQRFRLAGRVGTGVIFLAFLAYFIDEVAGGEPWRLGHPSEPTPVNALLGLLIFGVPCLRYAIQGRFGIRNVWKRGCE